MKLWARAGLAAGTTMHAGPHAADRLDAGNVLGGAPSELVHAVASSRTAAEARDFEAR